MAVVGFDLGYGWTKVCYEGNCFKFPTWLAYHSNDAISELDKVVYDGREYVVGEDAKYERQKIIMSSVDEMLNYYPVFKKYALNRLGLNESDVIIVTGLPPAHKHKAEILQKQGAVVLPQGVGIYLDVQDKAGDSEVLILDIGFNTVDFIITAGGKKKRGNTLEKMGVERMVELFRNRLDIAVLKQFSLQRLMDIFEKGYATVEGERIDLNGAKLKAIEEYNEILMTRLKDEIGNVISEIETIVMAGGGAYYINHLRKSGIIIPDEPEFSQARGYARYED